jgi:DNA-binding transcriptional LysR family regulator
LCIDEQQAMANRKSAQNWDDLRYFLAVARTGTLSAAAEQLGTEHTTVARHIHALEDELSSRLFHRSSSGYELTDAGGRLLAGAEAIESAYACAKAAASSEGQTIIGTVRIGAPDGFGCVFLAPRVRALTDRHPGLQIEILATALLFSPARREADIAIVHSRTHQMRVVSRRLTDFQMYVYGSRAYLNEAAPIVGMEDLKQHPFIGYVEEVLFAPYNYSGDMILDYANAIGAAVERRIRSTNILAQLHATLSGSGLCLLPAYVGSQYPTLVPVLTDKVSVTRSIHMHIHEDHRRVSPVREVAAFIAAEVERNQALFNAPAARPVDARNSQQIDANRSVPLR